MSDLDTIERRLEELETVLQSVNENLVQLYRRTNQLLEVDEEAQRFATNMMDNIQTLTQRVDYLNELVNQMMH
jgi:prefoldin subunit 5